MPTNPKGIPQTLPVTSVISLLQSHESSKELPILLQALLHLYFYSRNPIHTSSPYPKSFLLRNYKDFSVIFIILSFDTLPDTFLGTLSKLIPIQLLHVTIAELKTNDSKFEQ